MTFTRVATILLLGLYSSILLVSCKDQNVTEVNVKEANVKEANVKEVNVKEVNVTAANVTVLNEPDFATPEYILPCSRKDPKIDSCFLGTLNHIQPYLVKGIPELELPSIEPLVIPELKIENGQGPVRIRAFFTNITAIGPGNYSINKVRVNISSYRIDLHISLPKIEVHGNYDINGNVLLFPIQSHGNFWALFGDVEAIGRIQGVEEIRDGIRYMRISRLLIDFSLGRVRFRIMDHLNGNNVIGQAMNQFLNQNAKEIIEEMRPAASASIAKHFKEFLNSAFSKLPMKIWMHDT